MTLWQKFKERNKRILSEVTQIQTDLAKEAPRSSPRIVSHRGTAKKTIYFFWTLVVLGAILGWWFLRLGQ